MTEKIEVGDIRGDLVSVGDRIAYSTHTGHTAALRVGTVTEIKGTHQNIRYGVAQEVPTKLVVDVDYTSIGFELPTKPVIIDASLKRFVKVGQ